LEDGETTRNSNPKISADELEISAEDLDYSNEAKEKLPANGDPMEMVSTQVFW
jgi:hypothetical protein